MSYSRLVLFALLILISFSCENNDIEKDIETRAEKVSGLWYSDYQDKAGKKKGYIFFEIDQNEKKLSGRVALLYNNSTRIMYIKGEVTGSRFTISLDKSEVDYKFTFEYRGTLSEEKKLEGKLNYSVENFNINIKAGKIEEGSVSYLNYTHRYSDHAVNGEFVSTESIYAAAVKGKQLWLSIFGGKLFMLENTNDTLIVKDTLETVNGGINWMSTTLTANKSNLFGHIPGTYFPGGGQYSGIRKIKSDGTVLKEFKIDSRISGMTHDGNHLWALDINKNQIINFDESGNMIKTIDCKFQSLIYLEYADGYFWSIYSPLDKLFQFNKEGKLLTSYSLKKKNSALSHHNGLTYSDGFFWYIFENRLYKLLLKAIN